MIYIGYFRSTNTTINWRVFKNRATYLQAKANAKFDGHTTNIIYVTSERESDPAIEIVVISDVSIDAHEAKLLGKQTIDWLFKVGYLCLPNSRKAYWIPCFIKRAKYFFRVFSRWHLAA
jgi:hypothetical protein